MGTVKKGKNRHGGNPPMCRRGFTRCWVVVGFGRRKETAALKIKAAAS